MDLVIMSVTFQVCYRLLPIGRQDIFVLAGQSLMDLWNEPRSDVIQYQDASHR